MSKSSVIAIDGPAGSGKSSLAKDLSEKLHIHHIDTGAMFRGLAYIIFRNKIDYKNDDVLNKFLLHLQFEYAQVQGAVISCDGEVLDQYLRNQEISKMASQISVNPIIRDYLLQFQRKLVQNKKIATNTNCVNKDSTPFFIMEGRDIGSVVFPDAFLKFYITASVEERAKRRVLQLQEMSSSSSSSSSSSLSFSGSINSFEQVLEDIKKRDQIDQSRTIAPLLQAEDAHFIDSSNMEYDSVLEKLLTISNEAIANFKSK